MASTTSQETPAHSGSDGVDDLVVKRSITITLALALFLGVLVPVCGLVAVMYRITARGVGQITQTAEDELRERVFDHLLAVRDLKKIQIEDYFREVEGDIEAKAANPFVRDAFLELDAAAAAAAGRGLKGADILKDPQYKLLHDKYLLPLREYAEQEEVGDILFLCAEHGDISFTLAKSDDLGRRTTEDMADSPLADAWRQVVAQGTTALSDVRPYEPAGGTPCQFIATPFREDGATIGVLAFRVSLAPINALMGLRAGMGETGETILVGPDYLMRSDSFRDPTNHSVLGSFRNPNMGRVDTVASRGVHEEGTTETVMIEDYIGNDVVVAFTPIQAHDMTWALLTKIDQAEAFAAVEQVRQIRTSTERSLTAWAPGLTGLCLLSVALVGLGVHWKVARPIRRMAHAAARVARGDLTVKLPVGGKSETGALARAMNQMTENLTEIVGQISTASVRMEAASREQAVGANSQGTATTEMSTTAGELLTTAQQVAKSGTSVSEQASTAADECASGVKSVQDAVQGITGIRDRVEWIAEHMVDLGGKSRQISGVLDIINELAEQTNLLSLNASIEAAGAGEAGKRFAVVASEIRKLAERAGESTTEIRGLIDSIQYTIDATIMATEEGTKAVKQGVRLTEEAEGYFERIASQVASTRESAKAIEMASRQQATALEQMDGAVRNIDATAHEAAATSRQVQTEAQALAEAAGRFQIGRHGTQTR